MVELFDLVVKCRACKGDVIWLKTKKGKSMPVNSETVQGGDAVFDQKKHTSHFATCPFADTFRGKQ